jgi:hypothetical protein
MELINARLVMDSAESTKLDANSGQHGGPRGVDVGLGEAGVARRKCCVIPILPNSYYKSTSTEEKGK